MADNAAIVNLERNRQKHAASLLNDVNQTDVLDGAFKYGSLMQRVRWIINTLVAGVALLTIGVIEAVVWLLFKSYTIFMFLYYGILLLIIRTMILFMALELAKVSTLLADIIDAILWYVRKWCVARFS